MNLRKSVLFLAAAAALVGVGCGGTQGAGGTGGGGTPPPPPPIGSSAGSTEEREVSKATSKDFAGAVERYNKAAEGGWTSDECSSVASEFEDVGKEHKLPEAYFNAGLAHHHCNELKEAEKYYQKALEIDPNHEKSLSNLGEIYFGRGNENSAKQYWERAVKADLKVVAARNNLAWLLIRDMRKSHDRGTFARLEKEAAGHLSRALAVENNNVEAYVLYSLLYQEGWERNKSRLDIAKLLLDEGAKHNDSYAPLYNARGLLDMKRNNISQALKNFERAVQLQEDFVEARMNVGNIVIGFRKYADAKAQFEFALSKDPKNYDAMIGLGIALRGTGDLDGAEKTYVAARKLDSRRPEAYYNLAVLYRSFRSVGDNLSTTVAAYKKARGYYKKFLSKADGKSEEATEAKNWIKTLDNNIKQAEEAMRAMKGAG